MFLNKYAPRDDWHSWMVKTDSLIIFCQAQEPFLRPYDIIIMTSMAKYVLTERRHRTSYSNSDCSRMMWRDQVLQNLLVWIKFYKTNVSGSLTRLRNSFWKEIHQERNVFSGIKVTVWENALYSVVRKRKKKNPENNNKKRQITQLRQGSVFRRSLLLLDNKFYVFQNVNFFFFFFLTNFHCKFLFLKTKNK